MENNDGAINNPVQEGGFERSNSGQPNQGEPMEFYSSKAGKADDGRMTPGRWAFLIILVAVFFVWRCLWFIASRKKG